MADIGEEQAPVRFEPFPEEAPIEPPAPAVPVTVPVEEPVPA